MSTAIARARDTAELARASGQEAWRFAQALSTAGLLPKAYRDQPGNVLLAMEYGRALGLPVATVLTSVHVIDGRPSMSAELMQALIRRAGHRIRITGDRQSASCAIVRKDDPDFTYTATFTMDDARAAKLVKPDSNWVKYPQAMLLARATSACARQACADVLAGVSYVPEELGDGSPSDALMAVVEQASASVASPAPHGQGDGPQETAKAPSAPSEHPPRTDDPTPSKVQQERQQLQAEQDSDSATLAGKARLDLLDELTGALDAAVQALDLEVIAAVGQRADQNNVPALVDEARSRWFEVHAQLVAQDAQPDGQG